MYFPRPASDSYRYHPSRRNTRPFNKCIYLIVLPEIGCSLIQPDTPHTMIVPALRGGDLRSRLRSFGQKIKNNPRVRHLIDMFKGQPRDASPLVEDRGNGENASGASSIFHARWGTRPPSSGDSIKFDMNTPPRMRGGGPSKHFRSLSDKTKDHFRKAKERVGAKLLGAATMGNSAETSSSLPLYHAASPPRLLDGPAKQPTITQNKVDSQQASIHSQQASIHNASPPTSSKASSVPAQSLFADSVDLIDPNLRCEEEPSQTERTYTFPPTRYPAFNERTGFIAVILRNRRFGNPLLLHERRVVSL